MGHGIQLMLAMLKGHGNRRHFCSQQIRFIALSRESSLCILDRMSSLLFAHHRLESNTISAVPISAKRPGTERCIVSTCDHFALLQFVVGSRRGELK
jgi:hypothetical protein